MTACCLDIFQWMRAGALFWLIVGCFGLAVAADGLDQQIERAQVQREIQESPLPRVLPPARLDTEPIPGPVQAAGRADQRWRSLLSKQQAEKNRLDAVSGAPARGLLNERQQRADDLSDRIHLQDREMRQGGGR
jgi:hypothetical protein